MSELLGTDPAFMNPDQLDGGLVLAEPTWFGITVGRLAYASNSTSLRGALENVADEVKPGMSAADLIVVPSFASVYPGELQARYRSEFAGRRAVRLIPLSDEPWPDNLDNLTEAQREAMSRLGI